MPLIRGNPFQLVQPNQHEEGMTDQDVFFSSWRKRSSLLPVLLTCTNIKERLLFLSILAWVFCLDYGIDIPGTLLFLKRTPFEH